MRRTTRRANAASTGAGADRGRRPVSVRRLTALLIGVLLALVGAPITAGPAAAAATTPLSCDGQFYGMQDGRQLFRINFASTPFTYTPLGTDTPFSYNALGFNHQDGYLYGIANSFEPPHAIRFDAAGGWTDLGPVAALAGREWLSGAFLPDGRYVVATRTDAVAVANLAASPPVATVVAYTSAVEVSDFAVSPVDGLLYGFDSVTQRMVRIDPVAGTVVPFGVTRPAGQEIRNIGSAWFDAFGRFYAYGAAAGLTVVGQTVFYEANVGAGGPGQVGELLVASTGPLTTQSDGASCPFGVRMAKTVSPATVQAGGTVTYTYTITNRSALTQHPRVTDTMDGGRTFVTGSLTCTAGCFPNAYGNTNTLNVTGFAIAAGATFTLTVQAVVPATAPAGTLYNQARLSSLISPSPATVLSDFPGAAGPEDPTPLQVTAAPAPTTADLRVTKNGPAEVAPGAVADYTVSITNAGPATATGVTLVDTAPAGFQVLSASDGGSLSGQVVTWMLGTVAPGVTITRIVSLRAPAQGSGTNVADVTSVSTDPIPGNNHAQVTTTVTSSADLTVDKSGPAQVAPNGDATYTITVTNNGPSTASGATATDTLPAGFVPVSASDAGNVTGSSVTWSLGDMAPTAVLTRTVVARAPSEPTVATNSVSVTSSTADPNPGNNTDAVTTTVTAAADLAVDKSGPAQAGAGQEATYTVTVSNAGPSTAVGVTAADTLPAGFSFVSASAGGTFSPPNVVVWNLGNMPPGGTPAALTVVVRAPSESTVGTNSVTVQSDTPDANPANNTDTATTTVSAIADLAVDKSGPAEIVAGTDATYTFTVTNAGPSTASNATAVDTLPAGFAFVSASDGGTFAPPNVVTWSLGNVAPGAVVTRTVVVRGPQEGGAGTNTVTVTSDTPDANPADNTDGATTSVLASTDVSVDKSGPAEVLAGTDATYTVTVTNAGPSTATGVTAVDTLPAGFAFVSASDGGTYAAPNVATWNIGTLAPGAVAVRTVVLRAPAEAGAATNSVTVSSVTSDPNPANNADQVATTVVASANLAVDKSGPAEVFAGAEATYTLTVTNRGPSTASAVALRDAVPAGFGFVSASAGGQWVSGVVSWELGDMAPGATVERTVVLRAPNEAATLTNEASAASATSDPDLTDNRDAVTTTVIAVTDMSVEKTGPAEVDAGQPATYTLVVTNAGPSTAQGVVATDQLPPGFAVVSASDGGTVSPAGVVTWTLGTMAPGASRTVTVTARAPNEGATVVNRAHVDSTTFDPTAGNDDDAVQTVVVPIADIAIDKTAPATVEAGENLTYTLVVTNSGPSTATNVVVTDSLPDGIAFVSADNGGAQTSAGVVTWSLGTLAPGGQRTLTVTGTAALRVFTATNRADARSDTIDRNPANNADSVETRVVDTTPPVTTCAATTNPSGGNIPSAGDNPRSGQNPDGFYILTAVDRVDAAPTVTITDSESGQTFGPFPSGTKIKLTQAPGAKPNLKKGPGDIDWHITIKGDAVVRGVDFSGNVSAPVYCLVPPGPK